MQVSTSNYNKLTARLLLQWAGKLIAGLILALLRAYQYLLSPMMAPSCRFVPTCSEYAREAVEVHGPWRGTWLTLKRLVRCQPFCRGGLDPVPPASASQTDSDHEC